MIFQDSRGFMWFGINDGLSRYDGYHFINYHYEPDNPNSLAGTQPSYILSADGLTVYDNVTGLTWTHSPDLNADGTINIDDKLTFAEAQTYAGAVLNPQNYDGYSDWRLPTIKELYSLMNLNGATGTIPYLDTTYFDFAFGDTSAGERDLVE